MFIFALLSMAALCFPGHKRMDWVFFRAIVPTWEAAVGYHNLFVPV